MDVMTMRRALLITVLALTTLGMATSTASATFPGRNGPIAFRTWDPATGPGPLFRAEPDGTQVTQLSDLPGLFSDWRADGRRIAFDFFDPDGNEQIATMTAEGSDLRVITSGPGIHEIPSWSPSGRRIVFDFSAEPDPNTPGFETRLWTMRADGSKAGPLPMDQPGFDNEPRYSPNGRWIVFSRLRNTDTGQEAALYIVGAKGGEVRQLTPYASDTAHEFVEHPTWSPDSRWIIFDVGPDGTIEAIRPDGGDRHTILRATEGFGGHKPWFSPDGSLILFMCENQGLLPDTPVDYNEDICVMDADGSDVVKVIGTSSILENWPSWGPAPHDSEQGDDGDEESGGEDRGDKHHGHKHHGHKGHRGKRHRGWAG
jgi:Tol biopolymer transport system component